MFNVVILIYNKHCFIKLNFYGRKSVGKTQRDNSTN
jgi:hypothetical protein